MTTGDCKPTNERTGGHNMRRYLIIMTMALGMMLAFTACGSSPGPQEATTEAAPEGATVKDSVDIVIPEGSTGGIRDED